MRFEPVSLPATAGALRAEVRAFLAGHHWTPTVRARSWMGFDREFSREVGQRGWIGMVWPREYGGHARSGLERTVVLEEMLAAGAPVGAHWIGDRQSGPLILRLASEEQKRRILPGIARGELAFCIGLSEPEAGSDLAALRTRAERTPGGWKLNGRKIWTTFAHLSDYMIALVRTSAAPEGGSRHAGLSQFLVDLRLSGISIRPIHDMLGEASFNEVTFDDVLLPEDALLGAEGAGWAQATAELAYERSGPDRYLSSFPALAAAVDPLRTVPGAEAPLGRMVARLATLRQMSLSIGGMLERGEQPAQEAALSKDVGNDFEQALPEAIRALMEPDDMPHDLRALLDDLAQLAPTFSLRGGTREILRSIIARELGLR
ncbi:MAG: acyl-CoA dehydrogenase family protein [Alphaproteobacteria bacterium]|nr:acyl-CoA dehydrogenase family protein [Alphaproteobacteria bacterium]